MFSRRQAVVFARIRYFAKNECSYWLVFNILKICSCSFVFANMRVKLEHVRVSLVFVCLLLKYERNKGSINSFVVISNLET